MNCCPMQQRNGAPWTHSVRTVLLGCATWIWGAGAVHALEPAAIFKLAKANVVVVHALDEKRSRASHASGLVLPSGEVVTNCHAVRDATQIKVVQGEASRAARVGLQDLDRNLCQLLLESPLPGSRAALEMVPSTALEIGQSVYAIGAPYGEELTMLRGMIAGLRDKPGDKAKLIQTDVTVASGSSGGGLFDQEGRLVGVIVSGLTDAQNLNVALPTEWIAALPQRAFDQRTTQATAAVEQPAAPKTSARPPVTAPPNPTGILPGARWVYRMKGDRRDLGTVTFTVTAVDGDAITESVTREGYASFRFTRKISVPDKPEAFQPLLVLPGGYQLPELMPYVSKEWKPRPGEQWSNLGGEFSIAGWGKRKLNARAKVVRQTKISVPAGSFDTWQVEADVDPVEYQGSPVKTKCTYWYAPGQPRPVRMEIEILAAIEVLKGKDTYELLTYTPGQ